MSSICTYIHVSSKIIIDCLKLNKKIFCEKPPAKSINEMNKIKKYLKKNTKLMFGFNHRFHPAVIKAKNIIDNKKFGNVITVRGVYGKSGGINFRNSWRNSKKISGGGILFDQGIHMIDLFRYFINLRFDFFINCLFCFYTNCMQHSLINLSGNLINSEVLIFFQWFITLVSE